MNKHLYYILTIINLLIGKFLIENGVETVGVFCIIAFLVGFSDLLKEVILKKSE